MFDLTADPGEARPLAREAEPNARARLTRAALEHLQRRGDESREELGLRARVRQLQLEWGDSRTPTETLAS